MILIWSGIIKLQCQPYIPSARECPFLLSKDLRRLWARWNLSSVQSYSQSFFFRLSLSLFKVNCIDTGKRGYSWCKQPWCTEANYPDGWAVADLRCWLRWQCRCQLWAAAKSEGTLPHVVPFLCWARWWMPADAWSQIINFKSIQASTFVNLLSLIMFYPIIIFYSSIHIPD